MKKKLEKGRKFLVILHNIRSAYNVGSIFRTADAFGVDKIFLTGYTPDPSNNKKINKTALGAEKNINWQRYKQAGRLINELKKEKIRIIALEQASRSLPLGGFYPNNFSLALILGNEVTGIEKNILSLADEVVEIPMFGKKESLNVSVAFGIVAYLVKNLKK